MEIYILLENYKLRGYYLLEIDEIVIIKKKN